MQGKEKKGNNSFELAINILRLQEYNFDKFSLEHVVFFEWLIVKFRSFHFKEFHYSFRRITSETGLKKHTLNKLIQYYSDAGFLWHESRGMPKTSHFNITTSKIIPFIENQNLYSPDRLETMKLYFLEYQKEHDFQTSKKPDKKPRTNVGHLIELLNGTYESRLEMYNNSQSDSEEPERIKTYTRLYFNDISKLNLSKILKSVGNNDTVKMAFIAYIDDFLKGSKGNIGYVSHLEQYFVKYDEERQAFTVFEHYLSYFKKYYGKDR